MQLLEIQKVSNLLSVIDDKTLGVDGCPVVKLLDGDVVRIFTKNSFKDYDTRFYDFVLVRSLIERTLRRFRKNKEDR